jgi:putative ABC transport system permease protein
MSRLSQDFRYAGRMLVKYPAFTVVAVITLALGIGANAAMFSVIDAVLLRSLPFPQAGQLLSISTTDLTRGNALRPISYPTFLDWQSQNTTLESVSAWTTRDFTLVGSQEALHITGGVVSANLFSTLRVAPVLGRGFAAADNQPTSLAVILSHRLWRDQFNADPSVIGKSLALDGRAFSIIGVMPAGFQFPIQSDPVDLWTTIAIDALPTPHGQPMTEQRGMSYLNVLARRNPGVSIRQVQANLTRIQDGLNRAYPENRPRGVYVITEADDVVGNMRMPLLFLFGAVTLVLIIACANVANLLLTRFTGRQRELAIRSALGATRAAITSQLLTESILLSCLGGCVGLLLAFWAPKLVHLAPGEFGSIQPILDLRVFGFTLVVAVLTGAVFGMFPAVSGSVRQNLSSILNAGGRGGSGGVASHRTRAAILFAQVALTTVLLSGAGLLLRGLLQLSQVNPGFSSDHVVTFGLSLPSRYAGIRRSEFYTQLLDQIRNLHGVRRASLVQGLPMGSTEHQITTSFEIQGHPATASEKPTAELHINDFDYFHTLGIPLISGRDFNAADNATAPAVIIVNQAASRRFFGSQNPIGQRLRLDIDVGQGNPVCQIVGVVGDVRSAALGSQPVPEMYVPVSQLPVANVTVVVRTAVEPESIISELRTEVRALDRELPLRDVKTMATYLNASMAVPRFSTVLLGMFATLSLLLTAVGLYGVIADSLAQRTREIGIRLAVGAQRSDIVALVVKQGLSLVLGGALVGLAGAFALKRVLGNWVDLTAVGNGYIEIFLSVAALLLVIVFCVSYVPGLRATRVDASAALRQE